MLSLSSCLLLSFLLYTSATYQTDPFSLKLFANHLERRAACNDGSASGFAFKPGTGTGTKKWVVFLQGGSACFDYASCASRASLFKSSNQWGQIMMSGLYYRTGILDTNPSKNFFWNWNKIAVGYCTSDTYVGNSSAAENPLGLHFNGYGVMKALLEDIQSTTVMGQQNTVANAKDVLVVGHSAGGIGMLANIGRFAAAFPHAKVRAINDGGWMVKDYREMDPQTPSIFEVATYSMNLLWKPPASLSPICIGIFGIQLASLCVFQPTGYPFLGPTPMFTFHSQMDEWAARNIPRTLPLAKSSRVWQKTYRTLLLESFNVIDTNNKDDAVMSPNCFMHNVIQEPLFFSVKVNGYSYHDAVVAWMTGNTTVPRRLIRSCEYEGEPSCPNPSVQPSSPECGEATRPPYVFSDVGGGDCRARPAFSQYNWGSETTTNATAEGKCRAQKSCVAYMNTYPSAQLSSYTEYYCSNVEGVCTEAASVAQVCQKRFLDLGSACSYSIMAGAAITSTGFTKLVGDLALHPGTSVTGAPEVVGVSYVATSTALQAKLDLGVAYTAAQGLTVNKTLMMTDLGSQTLFSGVYYSPTSMGITGTLYLDAQNDPEAYWVFQMGTTLTTAMGASVVILNPAGNAAKNLFWAVGSSATLGATSTLQGTIMAYASITVGTGAITGPLLASNGAVTLLGNIVTSFPCCSGTSSDFTGRRCFKEINV